MVAICSVMLVLLMITNFAVSTFFRYYSMISVTEEEDYSDILVSLSDEESTAPVDVKIELPEESAFYDKDVLNILLIGTDERNEHFYNLDSRKHDDVIVEKNAVNAENSLF